MTEPVASVINFTTIPWLSTWTDVKLEKTSSTSTSAFYQIYSYGSPATTPSWMDDRYQIEFRYNSNATGLTTVYCNTNNHANDDVPYFFANGAVSQDIDVGDTITAYANDQTTIMYTLTVTSGMLWTSSGGSGGGSGPNPLSSLVPRAEIVNGDTFEMRGYATGSYALTSPTHLSFQSTWNVTSATNNVQHSVANLAAGTYVLSDSILLYNIVTLYVTNRKVFCNFW